MNGTPEARVSMTKAITLSNGTVLFPVHLTRSPSLRSIRYVGNIVTLPTKSLPEATFQFDAEGKRHVD